MNQHDYDFLRKLLRERSGLVLAPEKHYLVESRLLPLVRKNALSGLEELVGKVRAALQSPLTASVVEAMTTNESFFFRDKVPFENFKEMILPALLAARAKEKRIRIWCNACSTGQEPYSLAMILDERSREVAGWKIEILATDISNDVLTRARAGVYSQFEVQRGLPIQSLVKNFTQTGEQWQISPHLRSMVTFKAFNLLGEFVGLGMFDVIFCRNVLIYFDQETKTNVLNRLARVIAPDGFLALGAAETVVGLTEAFKPMRDHRGIYTANATNPVRAAVPHTQSPPLAPAMTRTVTAAKA